MMRQSGTHLFLLLFSAVSLLLPDHHRAGTPRAPKILLSAAGPALAAPAKEAGLIDIYPPLALPEQPPYLLLALLLLAVLAVAAALVLLARRRRSAPPPLGPDPAAAALAELGDAQQRLAGSDPARYARYAEAVSAILRRYCERRFNLSATRRTTAELLGSLPALLEPVATPDTTPARGPADDYRGELQRCLQLCDLVKYAGLSPEPAGVELLTGTVRSFIDTTREPSTPAEV